MDKYRLPDFICQVENGGKESVNDGIPENKKARLGGSRAVTLSRCDNLGGAVAQVDRKINNRCKCVKLKKVRQQCRTL